MSADSFSLRAELRGHGGWVTAIATTSEAPDTIISASRDKSLILWNTSAHDDPEKFAVAKRRMTGHNHYVSDVAISSDGLFALSSSWDSTLRLWDLTNGKTTRRFIGHSKDVLSVGFSADNRHIVSGGRDKEISLWNTVGHRKVVITENTHKEWISCVRFSPTHPLIVSSGWDKMVKVWDLQYCSLKANLVGHNGYVNTVTVSPDGSLCASGGKDGTAMLWDLNEGKHLSSLDASEDINGRRSSGPVNIHALAFSPQRYWLCAAVGGSIKIWDLETKFPVAELKPEFPPSKKAVPVQCISLAWSADGDHLFAGYTDNTIRVWRVTASAQ